MAVELYYGLPRAGKTWLVTKRVIRAMDRGRKTVFSNYPVYVPKKGTPHMWDRRMTDEVIVDSFIAIDEAYRDYDFRNHEKTEKFTKNEDYFYGTSGQNGNDIILITHSPVRVDPKIRDRVDIFHKITKQTLPFISFIWWILTDREIILWFKDEMYLTEEDTGEPYSTEYTLYSRKVSRAYDTRYFRTKEKMREDFPVWPDPIVKPPTLRELPRQFITWASSWIQGVRSRIRTAKKVRGLGDKAREYAKDADALQLAADVAKELIK